MKPFNRFDMEQQLMDCWGVCDDLETVCESVIDNNNSTDTTANLLIGLKELYQLKFEKVWNSFEAMCREQGQKNVVRTDYD